tara:strand:- start:36515 stop:42733 length:6219 start_codon:yes stop_codon:yes gene_type:complete
MAKKKKKSNTGNVTSTNVTNTFIKGMNKDLNASFVPKQSWFHAINAYNNSADGDAGTLGNEPANLKCADVPYPIIGAIHKEGDLWYVYSTDDISSEIGLLDDSKCEYTTIVNDPCLNFNRKYLITGASKENYDCTWQVYWDDNLNPSRTLNIDNIPYVQLKVTGPDINGDPCVTFEDTDQLDCEKIRLAPLVKTPCLELTRDIDGGIIRNGSYQAYIAYTVNEQVVTDYIGVSNIQSLFVHDDVGSSLNLKLSNLDQSFEFYELVILSNAKEQVVAKKIGIYSTEQNSVSIDFIDPALISVPLEQLFGRRPAYEKSESMYVVNDYLIRQGPTEQFDFNYQPLANQIQTKWQVAQYPADYYYKGGNKTSFMRDEQYAFFIRWIYNTGERSASYHIPGRAPRVNTTIFQNGKEIPNGNELQTISGTNVIDNNGEPIWQVYNTANLTQSFPSPGIPTDDGGFIIAEGDMAFWQSSERYPATKPEIYNASSNPIWDSISPEHDLCGEYIRHHKMPTEEVNASLKLSTQDGQSIRILGVKFTNIKRPLFNTGLVIPNIVGYEILRGSREGAKSIMAKGIFKNMREYTLQDDEDSINTSQLQGLYPNYPYNDLRDDIFFHTGNGTTGKRTENLQTYGFGEKNTFSSAPALKGVSRNVFTFHTPELPFRKPYLNAYETRFYGKYKGDSIGYFRKSEEHPGQKLLLNYPIIFAGLLGMGYAFAQFTGKKNNKKLPVKFIHHNPTYLEKDYTGSGGQINLISIPGIALSQPGVGQGTAFMGPTPTNAQIGILPGAQLAFDEIFSVFAQFGDIVSGGIVSNIETNLRNQAEAVIIPTTPGTESGGVEVEFEGSNFKSLPSVIRAVMSIPGFMVYTAEGANVLIDLFYNLMSYQDYALKHNSHGQYTDLARLSGSQFRSENIASNYIGGSFNIFGDAGNQLYKINNLFRQDTIAINTQQSFPDDPRDNEDLSRYNLGQLEFEGVADVFKGKNSYKNRKFKRSICSLYGSLKFKIDNQYGQLEGVKQTPMRGCIQTIDQIEPLYFPFESQAFFTGDVYINRYTEKTTMPIFTDFLYGQPDGFVYDYLKYTNIPYPRYWMNTERYDFTNLFNIFTQTGASINGNLDDYFSILPSDLYALDVPSFNILISGNLNFSGDPGTLGGLSAGQSLFGISNGYIYTHINGVQDFFVESELNIAQRDFKEAPERRHYDPYLFTDINTLFDAKIQKADNFYLYDYSLSTSRFITNLTSFGVIQPRDYNPQIAETCFLFYPKRLIYSLRAQEESKKDFWRVFLPNNYKDFKNKVSIIKPINQTGAIMFFPYASPKMFMGVDQLQTDLGTKVILGDGGLFAREPKNITNSDLANEYASCESARSVINTPMGVFFISQAQGKIFQYTGKLAAISDQGMKWWFNKYLPSVLLRQYPGLEGTELEDNPVVGIGCQAIYDINDDIVYFMKKDYSVKKEYIKEIIFDTVKCQFIYKNKITSYPIILGDPFFFDNASWTVSYDPKIKGWISFHDWHPELSLPSVNHFLTTKTFKTKEPKCPPGYVLNNTTGKCEKLIFENAPGFVDVDEKPANIVGNTCECDPGYTLVYPDVNVTPVIWDQSTGDCTTIVSTTTGSGTGDGSTNSSNCNCYLYFFIFGSSIIPSTVTAIQAVRCDGTVISYARDSNGRFPDSLDCIREGELIAIGDPTFDIFDSYKKASSSCGTYTCCKCYTTQVISNGSTIAPGYSVSYEKCDTGKIINVNLPGSEDWISPCHRAGTLTFSQGFPFNQVTITTTDCGTYPCDDNTGGGGTIVTTESYPAICRKIECGCPPSPIPNAVLTQGGPGCDSLPNLLFDVGDPSFIIPPGLITCDYQALLQVPPSFERGSIWRHNYRCDLFANYYGVDYPWEVELVENTGQMVTTLRSLEYQLESYVYKGDLINGCGDDRWHDLDFNFDKAIIYNSEQVSGLLTLIPHPKEDPLNMILYPIIGTQDIKILYSKEEQKFRFNQFWDITKDRGEFTSQYIPQPGITPVINSGQSIFLTELNGYIKDLNFNNLNYIKTSDQRKKFRHYFNKIILRRTLSGNRKMLLKLNNTKLNLSVR